MKVLFLDHDGVICLSTEWGSRYKNKEGLDSVFDRFNQKSIKVLNEIIEATDCEIIVSSDWRFHGSLSQMRDLYKIRGILKSPIGYTDYIKSNAQDLEHSRAQEILRWMNINDPKSVMNFCAVDDLDMSIWLTENFVHTPRSSEGIKQSGIKEKVIKILNHGNNPTQDI
jgi:hypothetical protein